jgi:hypothetical protein
MLKVDDMQAITDYCRALRHSARKPARVFQRSRNTIARVLKEGAEGIRPGEVRRREPQVLLAEHQRYHRRCASGSGGRPGLGQAEAQRPFDHHPGTEGHSH